jgi:hypothetical protein
MRAHLYSLELINVFRIWSRWRHPCRRHHASAPFWCNTKKPVMTKACFACPRTRVTKNQKTSENWVWSPPKNEIPPENQLPHFIFQVLCWFQGGYEYLATICNDKEFIGTLTHPESSTLSVATRITPVPMGIPRSPSLSTTISANRTASRKCKNSFDPNTDRSRTTTQGEGCRRTPLASSKQTGRQWKSFDPLSPRSSERQFLV